jgi:signal transduction histidine kinase
VKCSFFFFFFFVFILCQKIREELRLVDVGIKEKAQDEVHRVEKERERLKKLQEGGSQPNVGGKR